MAIRISIASKILLSIAFLLLGTGSNAQSKPSALKIGDPAPPLKIVKWLRGDSIYNLKQGHAYFVEFGSVNCGPCRSAIPHLTNLAKMYRGKVTIISVFAYENAVNRKDTVNVKYVGRVDKFISRFGKDIAYSVAVDDPKGSTAAGYLKASGQNAIPTGFVVDQHGVIVWIGQPFFADEVLKKVCEGSYHTGEMSEVESMYHRTITTTYPKTKKEFPVAIATLDSLISLDSSIPFFHINKFNALLRFDEEAAYPYGYSLLKEIFRNDEASLIHLASSMIDGKDLQRPDWNLAIALLDRAIELSRDDAISARLTRLKSDIKKNKTGNKP